MKKPRERVVVRYELKKSPAGGVMDAGPEPITFVLHPDGRLYVFGSGVCTWVEDVAKFSVERTTT